MLLVREPAIAYRADKYYLGIRTQTPMKGMASRVDQLFKELAIWLKQHDIRPSGLPFLRYYVIDMAGQMDIEVGSPTAGPVPGDERVSAGVLPAGNYASLVYVGSGLSGNKALIEWARASGYSWDRWDDPKGDAFRCRYEAYLTDPKTEPRKTKWEVEVAIKIKDVLPVSPNAQ